MQEYVEVIRDGITLRGMLHIPEGIIGKVPGVVIYHGFTGNRIEKRCLFVKLSRALERAGIANVRFDFYGSGESDGEFEDMTPETELKDAKTILDYMRSLDFVDKGRVGICGFSYGGYIGGITAGDNEDIVKSLCLWAPAGTIGEAFKARMAEGVKLDDNLYDIGGIKLNKAVAEAASRINAYIRVAAYSRKVCIIHGSKDEAVSDEVVLKYRNIIKNSELHTIEGANHTFERVDWRKELLDITVSFFKRTL